MEYRLYFLDKWDRISSVFPFETKNDQLAIAIATEHANGSAVELWNRGRMVMRRPIPPSPQSEKKR